MITGGAFADRALTFYSESQLARSAPISSA